MRFVSAPRLSSTCAAAGRFTVVAVAVVVEYVYREHVDTREERWLCMRRAQDGW